jgi:hypothetical protein
MPHSPSPQHRYDVFLSHHSSDKPQVEHLAARLEDEAKLKPFLDKWHLTPGQPWQEELEQALDQSQTCAVFLGPQGLGAWENEEMRAALDDRVSNKEIRVIPVLLPGADPQDARTLPRFLRRLTWVDFRAGLDDAEAFQRLVAGIRKQAPGRGTSPPAALKPTPRQWPSIAALLSGEYKKLFWTAVFALLLSTSFIGAAIPRYKLQIKSPAFKKDGIYEVPAGTVVIKWGVTKEQWFRETDISDAPLLRAHLTINKYGDATERRFPDQPGELKTALPPGKYEVRIDAAAYQRTETIALQVTGATQETATLSGMVVDPNDQPIQGAQVTIEELPGMSPVETSTNGSFTITEIPKPYHAQVRIRVSKEGHLPHPHVEDIVIGAHSPRVVLRRKK